MNTFELPPTVKTSESQPFTSQSPAQTGLRHLLTRLLEMPPEEQGFAIDRFRDSLLKQSHLAIQGYKTAMLNEMEDLPAASAYPDGRPSPMRELQERLCAGILYAEDQLSGFFGPPPESLQSQQEFLVPERDDW